MSIAGTIQGSDAVLSFYRDSWEPFLCSTDVSIQITASKVGVRTRGDGHWKKYTYQDVQFVITLSGLLKFDTINFTGWDALNNQLGFMKLLCRISFDDENGDVRTVQGYVMFETTTFSYNPGALVKSDFQLQGSGKLDVFDGLIPCPSVINSITVNGQEAADGTITATYTYTGDVYQVKYRVDGIGDYIYALADVGLVIPGLSVNSHTIEIIPICPNDYEGTGMTQSFVVTQAMTCSSSITGMVIHTADGAKYSSLSSGVTLNTGAASDYVTPVMTGSATQYMYAFDGGAYTTVPAGFQIPIGSFTPGIHNVGIIPVCTFAGGAQVQGSGMAFSFVLNNQPSQSKVNYSYTNYPTGNSLSIYVNGVLTISLNNSNASSSIVVANGAIVKAVLQSSTQPLGSRFGTLTVTDNTTSTTLFNQSASSPFTKQYSFTANGDEFTINGVVSA
jgi:hypothetical protein